MIQTALWESLAIAASGWLSIGAILIVLVLMSAERGLTTASMFVLGYWLGYLGVGATALLAGHRLAQVDGMGYVVGAVLSFFGVLFIAFAARNLRKVLAGQGDEPPRIFASLDRMRPAKALMFGAMVTVVNVKNLVIFTAAIGQLGELSLTYRFLALPLVVAVFCGALAVPLAVRVLSPRRAQTWLARMRTWLETHSRRISIALLSLFGGFFLYRGLSALFGQ